MSCGIPNNTDVLEQLEKLFDKKAWFVSLWGEPLILFTAVVGIGEESYGFNQSVSCLYRLPNMRQRR